MKLILVTPSMHGSNKLSMIDSYCQLRVIKINRHLNHLNVQLKKLTSAHTLN